MKLRITLFFLLLTSALALSQDKPAKPKSSSVAAPAVVPAAVAPEVPKAPPTTTDASNDTPAQITGIFFGLLGKSEIDPAYDGLTKGSKIAERPEEVKTLKTKTREAIEVFGPIISHELIESKRIGVHLLRRTYLSLNKEFPLRWRFYFYLSDNVWRLIDMRVDDRVTGMFDEADEPKNTDAKQ